MSKERVPENARNQSSTAQLNAAVILISQILVEVSGNSDAAKTAREKAAVALVRGGFSAEKAAKVLGLQKQKVVTARRSSKI